MWAAMEPQSVAMGLRRCCLLNVAPRDFVERAAQWTALGLVGLPLGTVRNQGYASRQQRPRPDETFDYRVVVGRAEDTRVFKDAYDASDHEQLGGLLGYPSCCTSFFRRVWSEDRLADTTWPMAVGTPGAVVDGLTLESGADPFCNILWRWIGIRAVPHLPCSFHCAGTIALGEAHSDVARESGHASEFGWLTDILSWPLEWSALHGIAEIKTPILKFVTNTDATAERLVVRLRGLAYPAEGARGGRFPYQPDIAAEDGAHDQSQIKREAWFVRDNGFGSLEAMQKAHASLLDAAMSVLTPQRTPPAVVDLGCGNGALLRSLLDRRPDARLFGVEIDEDRARRSRRVLPEGHRVIVGDLASADRLPLPDRIDLALVSIRRIVELAPERRQQLMSWLRARVRALLVYAYDDTLRSGGRDLVSIARSVTMTVTPWGRTKHVGFAALEGGQHGPVG